MTRRIKDSTLATLREVIAGDPYHRQFEPLTDEIDQLRAAIERVRALHRPTLEGAHCVVCHSSDSSDWDFYPCPTLRALEGAP